MVNIRHFSWSILILVKNNSPKKIRDFRIISGLYPGQVTKMNNGDYEVEAMEPVGKYFKWPTKRDLCLYKSEDIKKISDPIPYGSRANKFYFKDFSN